MTQTANLRVIDAEPEEQHDTTTVDSVETQSHYADADEFALGDYEYPVPGFIRELLAELDKDMSVPDARLVDTIKPSKDIDDGMLVAWPDESLMFIGKDPTAKDQMPWYAFTVEPMEPVPTPETATDALDLLKPPEVRDVVTETDWIPNRHGEWWLLPTQMIPASDEFKPGVASQPYGPSPLANHVPREYAFTNTNNEFMATFENAVPEAPDYLDGVPDVLEWAQRQHRKEPTPDYAPDWADIREWAGDVLVKGTIRHRDDDHFVETCETWHKAVTHRIEVYTSDAVGEGVHLDYYGTNE